jgi:adenylosuccinate synthase
MAHVDRQLAASDHSLEALMSSGMEVGCGTTKPRRCAFFLCALWKKYLIEIRGFDEDYVHAWTEDDDLADRLIDYCGVRQIFTDDIVGLHLWHPNYCHILGLESSGMYVDKTAKMRQGLITHIRNLDRQWGYHESLDSHPDDGKEDAGASNP